MKKPKNTTIITSSLAATVLALSGCVNNGGGGRFNSPGTPIETTGVIGSPDATTTISGKQLPPPAPKFARRDQGRRAPVETVVAAARGAAEEGAQHPADHDR